MNQSGKPIALSSWHWLSCFFHKPPNTTVANAINAQAAGTCLTQSQHVNMGSKNKRFHPQMADSIISGKYGLQYREYMGTSMINHKILGRFS